MKTGKHLQAHTAPLAQRLHAVRHELDHLRGPRGRLQVVWPGMHAYECL
jgi:hypothetical protein